jgi:hypothetical protein
METVAKFTDLGVFLVRLRKRSMTSSKTTDSYRAIATIQSGGRE